MKFISNLWARFLIWVAFGGKPVMERPIDVEIDDIWRRLGTWNHDERKEIIVSLMKKEWPGTHVHSNPVKRQRQQQTEIAA